MNPLDSPLAQIPLTGGAHWKQSHVDDERERRTSPRISQRLYVFTPPHPLAKGDSVVIGWKFDGRFPGGVTKNGGNTDEFILPSGVVLTGFTPSFVPGASGFMEDVGRDKENKTEPRHYPRDYWKGITRAGYGATAWFPARISVTGPAEYTLNSVGVCTSNTVRDGWRTQVWETDHPVKILNIVCGRWMVKQGQGDHRSTTARPTRTTWTRCRRRWTRRGAGTRSGSCRIRGASSSFPSSPALAGYAQGFGTNITFSENIGFLTKNDAQDRRHVPRHGPRDARTSGGGTS